MRCARDLSFELELAHDHISPRAYGLYTGLATCYGRPFQDGEYGPLEGKWGDFPGRPELRKHHIRLLDHRNKLLAHNDLTPHRAMFVWPEFKDGKAAVIEARSPINATGVTEARELFDFQHERFSEHAQGLADRLQKLLGWRARAEVELHAELQRLRSETLG